MECPDPNCEGSLVLNRITADSLGPTGEVISLDPTGNYTLREDWDNEYVICNECGDLPSYSWDGNRIVLINQGKEDSK